MKWKLEAEFRGRKWTISYRLFVTEFNHGSMLQHVTWLKLCNSHITTLDAMEMDGGMKESQYFHSTLPCWSEVNLLFHQSFVVAACVGRCQGLWYFPHLCYPTFLHCQMRSILEKWFHLYYQQWYLCLDHLKEPTCFWQFFCNFGVINILVVHVAHPKYVYMMYLQAAF
jgi:hypothetical protein